MSTDDNLLQVPSFKTMTYKILWLRYHCANLWNQTFKHGTIQINSNRQDDVKISEIETKNRFKKVMKAHYLYMHSLEWVWLTNVFVFTFPLYSIQFYIFRSAMHTKYVCTCCNLNHLPFISGSVLHYGHIFWYLLLSNSK